MKYKIAVLALLLLFLISGCQSNALTGQQILIKPATETMKPGQTLTLEVIVTGQDGQEIDANPVWVVENPLGILDRVTGKQVHFTASKAGTTRIKATAKGLTAYAQITIVEPVLTQLTLAPSTIRLGVGQVAQLTLTALDQYGDPMTVSPIWTVNPPRGTIDEHQRFIPANIGVGKITVTVGSFTAMLDFTVEAPVDFPDPGLKNALLRQLQKTDANLFPYELEQITELTVTNAGITNLIGLTYCTNLTTLNLENNAITDLRPLSGLTELADLNLRYNEIEELAPLAFLTGLRSLLLGGNESLVELQSLESLTSLERLDISNTGVDDLGELYGMERMRELDLAYCSWLDDDDLGVLIHMQNLNILDIKGTFISNLEPLKGMTSLTDLDIRSAFISDLTPLATCSGLTTLIANDNGIRDIKPLANLKSLKRLNLSLNQIIDLTPLQGLTNLDMLYLAANQIEDISPLVHNTGLGSGDQVDISENLLDLTAASDDMRDIQTLIDRGVVMIYF